MTWEVGKPYWVKWLDAAFAWDDPGAGIGSICQSVGWVVKSDDDGIRLAFEVGKNGIADGTRFHIDIPLGMVVEYCEMELP